MIITEITAGLGNQLFQYANAKKIATVKKQILKLDLSFFERYYTSSDLQNTHVAHKLDKFNTNIIIACDNEIKRIKRKTIKPDILRRIFNKLGMSGYVNTKCHFDNERIDSCELETLKNYNNLYISGYFGDQKYFIEIEDIIRQEFTLKEHLNSTNEKVLSQIKNSNSVSIHFRRGDYLNNPFFAKISLDYYRTAIDFIEKFFPNLFYFIFSDDLNWVKDNFKFNASIYYVDVNDEKADYIDLMLMSSCKHNIIANSTFSWWGAWLNNNPDKMVIAPKQWFNDPAAQKKYENGSLVPDKWRKI